MTTPLQARAPAAASADYATQHDPHSLRLQRRLPGPVERVWAYLTDGELRRQWLAAGAMTLAPGAPFELVWRNDELSAADDPRPAGFAQESRATCHVTEVRPLRTLAFTWPNVGEVTFELQPEGDEVLLTLTHRRLADRPMTLLVGAGWHMHLDILCDRVAGRQPDSFWSGWQRLRQAYDERLPH